MKKANYDEGMNALRNVVGGLEIIDESELDPEIRKMLLAELTKVGAMMVEYRDTVRTMDARIKELSANPPTLSKDLIIKWNKRKENVFMEENAELKGATRYHRRIVSAALKHIKHERYSIAEELLLNVTNDEGCCLCGE